MDLLEKFKNYYSRAYEKGRFPSFTNVMFSDKKVIAYFGHLGDKNFGDELVYEANKILLSDCIVVPVLKHSPLPFILFKKLVNAKTKGVVIGGGTLIGPRFYCLELFEELTTKGSSVFLHGTGVHKKGALHASWAKELSKKIYGGIRGPISKRNLLEVGVDMKIIGDGAFVMHENIIADNSRSKRVLVNIGTHEEYPGEANARLHFDALIEHLIGQGYDVQFLPYSGIDVDLAVELQKKFPKLGLLTIPETYQDAVKHYRESCFAVGERLHFNIMSLLGSCPFLSINYDKKHEDFLLSVSLEKMGLAPEDITLEKLIDAFEKRNEWNFTEINKVLEDLKNIQIKEAADFTKSFAS